jgi:hypothetical protein
MIYRGYDSELFVQAFRNIKEIEKSTGWEVNQSTLDSTIVFFRSQKDFEEMETLLRISFDYYYIENLASKAIYLDNQGNIQGNDNLNQTFAELGGLLGFSKVASEFGKIGLNIPIIGEVISGFSVLSSFVGLFSNEARTKSFEAKNKLGSTGDGYNYNNYQGVERDVRRVSRIALLQLSRKRPLCQSPSNPCYVEHLRFALRAELQIAGTDFITEMVSTFLNDTNFKKFIDEWKFIKAQIKALPPNVINLQTNPPSPQVDSGCLGVTIFLTVTALTSLGLLVNWVI